jgi:hypothetical protein
MKALLAPLTIALLGLGATACGEVDKRTGSAPKTASNAAATGGSPARVYVTTAKAFDGDDAPVRFFGHEASAAERQPITALLTHYYAAAAKEDGAKACPLIHSLIAETIPEDYGQTPALRGTTCAVVMSKLFKQHHRQLVIDSATLEVTSVRVEGGRALALLRFAKAPVPNHIPVHREGRTWKIWELLDGPMP